MKNVLDPRLLLLFAIAASAEYLAVSHGLLMHTVSRKALAGALLLHLGASVIMATAQGGLLPPLYHNQRRPILLLLGAVNFIVPVFGMLTGWLLLLWGFRKSQDIRLTQEVDEIDTENLSERFPVVSRSFGEGSLPALIVNSYVPSAKKIRAISLLTEMKSKASLDLIKKTLQDPNDEVRLVGFATLDNLEKRINEKIHRLKTVAQVQPDPQIRARTHAELAFTYWELLYQGLADAQLVHFIVENILREIAEAQKVITDDPKLYKLHGRVLLEQKRIAEAREAFLKALEYGLPMGEIAAFMAQIAFEEHNYDRIPYWMQKIPRQSLNYQLHALRSVWVREA